MWYGVLLYACSVFISSHLWNQPPELTDVHCTSHNNWILYKYDVKLMESFRFFFSYFVFVKRIVLISHWKAATNIRRIRTANKWFAFMLFPSILFNVFSLVCSRFAYHKTKMYITWFTLSWNCWQHEINLSLASRTFHVPCTMRNFSIWSNDKAHRTSHHRIQIINQIIINTIDVFGVMPFTWVEKRS